MKAERRIATALRIIGWILIALAIGVSIYALATSGGAWNQLNGWLNGYNEKTSALERVEFDHQFYNALIDAADTKNMQESMRFERANSFFTKWEDRLRKGELNSIDQAVEEAYQKLEETYDPENGAKYLEFYSQLESGEESRLLKEAFEYLDGIAKPAAEKGKLAKLQAASVEPNVKAAYDAFAQEKGEAAGTYLEYVEAVVAMMKEDIAGGTAVSDVKSYVKNLDETGVIRVGARVEPGDILIGKISPKGESDPSPEEKLLRAIFGDKAGDVKDSSLKANPSLSGVIIDKKLFQRAIKDRKSKQQDKIVLAKIDEEYEAKVEDLKDILIDKLLELTKGKTSQGVKDYTGAEIITKGSKFTATALRNLEYGDVQISNWTNDEHKNELIAKLIINFMKKYKLLDAEMKRKKFAITIGDELPNGILQMAKVYVAKKRKISVGDKLAGRHGNKGIVSKVVRQEDMPFLEDGRPVDLVLNPLGVPSRMNLGQIFEAILGAAGKKLGVKFATPIFDGAKLDDLAEWTDKAGLPRLCSTHLYDGETGERFDQPATVGITYFLKLGHMVEDKMHARSIGPYSLITQQPLGGKAQFGGQRFGEMEVWALEAFGASHVLQEILTIKSDDTVGRSKAYEAIVKGEPMPTPGIPESLNVLLHELRGLGLSITLD